MAKRKFTPSKKKEPINLENDGAVRKRKLAPIKEKKIHFRKWLEEEEDGEDIQLFEREEE